MPGYMQTMTAVSEGGAADPTQAMAAMSSALPTLLLISLTSIAAYMIIFAGILKLVIRGERPRLPFYLGFGADEWRLLGTWLLLILIFIGAYLLVGVVVALFGLLAVNLPGVGLIVAIVGMLAAFAAYFWLCLRFSLASPAAVGAQTIGVGPSWNTSKGNVWRLLAYWLILGVI